MTAVRLAGTADLDRLAELEDASFDHGAWSRSALAAELAAVPDTRIVVVAEDESQEPPVVGYASLRHVDGTADVNRIVVDPEHRQRGIGRGLLEELLRQALTRGCERVLLDVDPANTAAVRLYEEFGFHEIDRRARYYADGADALIMQKTMVGH